MHIRDGAGDTPNTVNTSVVRTRRYLTGREVEKLMEAARKHGRYGHRDATMILLAYRHGLRASELCDLQRHQVEINTGRLHVRRSKKGTPSVHPMQGDEIRALRRLQREQEASPYVFTSERGGPMSAKSFGTLFERLGRRAGMPFTIFPHMLRHACGYALANAGHDTRALQASKTPKNLFIGPTYSPALVAQAAHDAKRSLDFSQAFGSRWPDSSIQAARASSASR